jgi:Raf kinase inhibitor-like YbhB/YbcL family protein
MLRHLAFRRSRAVAAVTLALAASLLGCDSSGTSGGGPGSSGTITVRSTAFEPGAAIPAQYQRQGPDQDVSPPLTWSGAPSGTVEYALVCDDPDAKNFVHWVAYGIGAETTSLAEGVTTGLVEGTNGFKEIGWSGPRPPKGDGPHHYHFKIYALDAALGKPPGLTKGELLEAMNGHVLAEGDVVGTFERK